MSTDMLYVSRKRAVNIILATFYAYIQITLQYFCVLIMTAGMFLDRSRLLLHRWLVLVVAGGQEEEG